MTGPSLVVESLAGEMKANLTQAFVALSVTKTHSPTSFNDFNMNTKLDTISCQLIDLNCTG